MGRRPLGLGEAGEIDASPQRLVDGKWTKCAVRSAQRWRARCYYRGPDGIRRDVSRVGASKRKAVHALEAALTDFRASGDLVLTPTMPLASAGVLWLQQVGRRDSRLSATTVKIYGEIWHRHVVAQGSSLRGLTLHEANDPQRLRAFLQRLADSSGSGTAKTSKSCISGVLQMAVENGVLAGNAMRQVRPVQSQQVRESPRDHTRALTRVERAALMAYADSLAAVEDRDPRTERKWQAAADLIAFMAGTGVRISEAAGLRWEHLDLETGRARIYGTKSVSAKRALNLPTWLQGRLRERAEHTGAIGLVFPSPTYLDQPETPWDKRNLNRAVRDLLDGAGLEWAISHSLRRSVASMLHDDGVPLVRIADQLGHRDTSQVLSTYLARDFQGDKSELAKLL